VTSDRNLTVEDHHECSRLCKVGARHSDGRIDGEAFRLKEGEPYLSLNCVDFHDGDLRVERIDDLRKVIIKNFTIRTQLLALFEAGSTIEFVRENSEDDRVLTIEHHWEEENHSHCGAHGFIFGEEIIADLLAETVEPENVISVKVK